VRICPAYRAKGLRVWKISFLAMLTKEGVLYSSNRFEWKLCGTTPETRCLFPCGDVKGDGIGGKVDADAMFCSGLIGVPGDERRAGLFIELVFLVR